VIATGSTSTQRRRGVLLAVMALAVVVAATIWWAGASARRGGVRGDPASTDPDGARAAVLLLERAGLAASGGPLPEDGDGTVVVLNRRFSAGIEADLAAFVAAGGTAVVAAGGARATANGSARVDGSVAAGCPVDGLDDVAELRLGTVRTLEAPDAAAACFPVGDGYLVVVTPEGAGTRVSVGSVEPFLNRSVHEADNSVLVVRLAELGGGPVTLLDRAPTVVGEGSRSLVDLLPDWFWALVAQGAVAVAALVVWKGLRFGRPVEEVQPVQIEANALVEATGRLLGRSRRPATAAELVVRRFREDLVAQTGLPAGCDDEALLDAAGSSPPVREVLAEAIAPVPPDLDRAGTQRRVTAVATARAALVAAAPEPVGPGEAASGEEGEWSRT
jgi:hypothetical protein